MSGDGWADLPMPPDGTNLEYGGSCERLPSTERVGDAFWEVILTGGNEEFEHAPYNRPVSYLLMRNRKVDR